MTPWHRRLQRLEQAGTVANLRAALVRRFREACQEVPLAAPCIEAMCAEMTRRWGDLPLPPWLTNERDVALVVEPLLPLLRTTITSHVDQSHHHAVYTKLSAAYREEARTRGAAV